MSYYKNAVLTDLGASLLAESVANGTKIEFVKLQTGSGIYAEEEKEALQQRTGLKEPEQEFGFSSATFAENNTLCLKAVINNDDLNEGYHITELGIIAKKEGDESEMLYSIAIAEEADYLPPRESPVEIVQDYYTKISNAESVEINVQQGAYATAEDMQAVLHPEFIEDGGEDLSNIESGMSIFTIFGKIQRAVKELITHLKDNNNPHKTNAEQVGLGNVPNVTTNDQTPTYEETAELTPLTSGEKLSNAFSKLAKAVTELISHISVRATQTVANQHPLGHVQVHDAIPDVNATNQCSVPSTYAVAEALRKKADSSHTHPYLPNSYVVYNNTTTVAGYALDARQANPNIAGSLAAQINAANTALTAHKTSADHDGRYYTETEVKNLFNTYLAVAQKQSADYTIKAGGTAAMTASCAVSGYTPIGIVGFNCQGTSESYCRIYRCSLSGTSCTMQVKNTHQSNEAVVKANFHILYRKNM